MIKNVKGTKDLLNMQQCNFILQAIKNELLLNNFSEIELPILEYLSLFNRSLGDSTEVVQKQLFLIEAKKEVEENKICLRPEATASTMRAFLSNQNNLSLPFKVFCYGPMFRYEQPQAGRLREFHQFNIEVIGADSVEYDAYFIFMLNKIFLMLLKNERKFELVINFLGELEERKRYNFEIKKLLESNIEKICKNCILKKDLNALKIFDCKNTACLETYLDFPALSDFFLTASQNEFLLLQATLKHLNVDFTIDRRLVRGLDYYNKTVFEFKSKQLGAQNSFCGGGRYDGLATQLGSKAQICAIGAAIGLERLYLILEDLKFDKKEKKLFLIIPISNKEVKFCLNLLAAICVENFDKEKIVFDILINSCSLKNKFKKAAALNADFVILVGEDEISDNIVKIKNMETAESLECKIDELKYFLLNIK